ncbi:NAD(P)-binding protein [Coniochaeta ligniaria NRRL 30616]|uniref:NAD(P)-binding protein n=1 Tax=Coniochaeta ligniaria NRRL 30616 TaxID=1408157 RepID=A0A1J7JYP4_9PEZI|nr:NAD(P)-binding protein [Coniochaeta ligniaria NRRL 30616]
MVAFTAIQESNSRVKSTFPSGLVAVFVGGTAGIGAFALKEFAHRAAKPRIYFIGRSQEAADKLLIELKSLNPGGEYIFRKCDTSLMRNIDDLCREIKSKETAINVLFMSQGTLKFGDTTSEGLHYVAAVTYYGRVRFMLNLLPLLRAATGLRRVVSVFAGTFEGPVFPDDWQARSVPMSKSRGHMTSMITMAHLKLAEQAPEVAFVQNYPGAVKTSLLRGDEGFAMQIMAVVFPVLRLMRVFPPVSAQECGERQTYYCTSGMYPAAHSGKGVAGVPLVDGVNVAPGVDGKIGSGVYSVEWDGEGGKRETEKFIREHREAGLVDKLWEHTIGEFERITGEKAV